MLRRWLNLRGRKAQRQHNMVGKLIEKVVRYLTESSAYFAEEVRNAEYQIQSLQGYKDNLQNTIDSNNELKKAVATLITEKEAE